MNGADDIVYSDVGILHDPLLHGPLSPPSPSQHTGLPGSGPYPATCSKERCLAYPQHNGTSVETNSVECQTRVTISEDMLFPTFSPSLSSEIIKSLDTDELNAELNYQETVLERKISNRDLATEFLRSGLSDSRRPDIDRILKSAHENSLLTLSLTCAIADCKKIVEDLKSSPLRPPRNLPPTPRLDLSPHDESSSPIDSTTSSAAAPVSPAPTDFQELDYPIAQVTIPHELEPLDLTTDELRRGLILGNEGSRRIAHFGTDYYYGGKLHRGRSYPKTPAMDSVVRFMEGAVPGFKKEQYSCTLNLYQDGRAGIPWHSDDEPQIAQDSSIYTLSFGASRPLEFRARSGPTRVESCTLEHGSLWAMSRASQNDWAHSIQPTTEPCGTRASLTFRVMESPKRDEGDYVPSIKKRKGYTVPKKVEPSPSPVPPPPRQSGTDRVLLLTDSIHRSMPAHAFPPHLHLEKRLMYKLTDLAKHESEFKYASYVVISSGINDLSRYGQTAESLSVHLQRKLEQYRKQFPGTTFVLNSVLLGSTEVGNWLNDEVKTFCEQAKRICLNYNVSFFDSHEVCRIAASRGTSIIDPRGNGIHITFDAKRTITRALVGHMLRLNTLTF